MTVKGNATLVNDYIWRGLTQTWGNPALQAGVEASHDTGAYFGLWGSNVSSQWVPGANLEVDLYGGIRRKFPESQDFGFDLGLIYVYYPDGDYAEAFDGRTYESSRTNTAEVYAGLSYKWLSVKDLPRGLIGGILVLGETHDNVFAHHSRSHLPI